MLVRELESVVCSCCRSQAHQGPEYLQLKHVSNASLGLGVAVSDCISLLILTAQYGLWLSQ